MPYYPTIDELVDLYHPNFVSVDNANTKTPGTAKVWSFQVDIDTDGIHLYVKVKKTA